MKMVIFHIVMLVYQRVFPFRKTFIKLAPGPSFFPQGWKLMKIIHYLMTAGLLTLGVVPSRLWISLVVPSRLWISMIGYDSMAFKYDWTMFSWILLLILLNHHLPLYRRQIGKPSPHAIRKFSIMVIHLKGDWKATIHEDIQSLQ